MIKKYFCINLFIILFTTFANSQNKVFSSENPLIELVATRENAMIDLSGSYSAMSTNDGRFWDKVHPTVIGIPDSLNNVKVYFDWMSNIQALYQSYKSSVISGRLYDSYRKAWRSDTTFCTPDYVNTFIVIATGTSNSGRRYYLFDSNNNHDLSDEKLYETSYSSLRNGNNNTIYQPHKVIYEKFIDGKIQIDSTWIAFFEDEEHMWLQFRDKASTSFELNSVHYTIDVIPSTSRSSRYSLGVKFNISYGESNKNEYYNLDHLYLGKSSYQLTCSNDGLTVFLTKDKVVQKEESTQVGMYPYKFKAKTLNGDSIHFPDDFKGKYVLLDFWSLTCAPCIQEIKEYYIDIYKEYGGDKFEIIGVSNNKQQDLKNFVDKFGIKWIIVSDEEQDNIQKKYGVYFYPTLYMINPDGTILGKNEDLRSGLFVSLLKGNIKAEKNAR